MLRGIYNENKYLKALWSIPRKDFRMIIHLCLASIGAVLPSYWSFYLLRVQYLTLFLTCHPLCCVPVLHYILQIPEDRYLFRGGDVTCLLTSRNTFGGIHLNQGIYRNLTFSIFAVTSSGRAAGNCQNVSTTLIILGLGAAYLFSLVQTLTMWPQTNITS